MNYQKGEQIPLYVEFVQNDQTVHVDIPRVRILKEVNEQIHEILPWKIMNSFGDGYIYNFDSNSLDDIGEYVVVYEGIYNSQKLNNIDTLEITLPNEASLNTPNSVKLYGFVNELGTNKLLGKVKIEIINLDSNSISSTVESDYSGKWETFINPGEYEFKFSLKGHKKKTLRVQVGDENSEVQFNNVSLERSGDKNISLGTFYIKDNFTDKTGKGIDNISIEVFELSDLNKKILDTKTDFYGVWEAYLNEGSYLLKLTMPSGVEKLLRMNINAQGDKDIKEFKKSESGEHGGSCTTFGDKTISDFIQDAHGNAISDVLIKVYQNGQEIGSTTSGIDGSFTLNLDSGIYDVICQKENFKEYKWELRV